MSELFHFSSLATTEGERLETPPPPLDPNEFDYIYYHNDLTLFEENWHEDPTFIPTNLTYGLTFILGVIGNGLVIFALLGDGKARNVTSSFLVSLAVADLVFLIVCVPLETSLKFKNYWAGSMIFCKIAGYVEMLTAAASVLNLTAVSVERYVVIVHPMRARSYCTMGKTQKIIVAVWVAAILLASPMIVVMDTDSMLYYNNVTYVTSALCADNNFNTTSERILFAWYQLIVLFIIPVIVMVFCYSIVIHVLWLSTKQLAVMTQTSKVWNPDQCMPRSGSSRHLCPSQRDHSADVREARKQVIKMLLTIIGIFFICWGPKLVLNVMKRHEMKVLHNEAGFRAVLVLNLLPFVQSCMNPIIYSFMSKNFRRSMRTSCVTNCHCDPTECCSKKDQKLTEFDMETKTMNGTSRAYSYSPGRNARSTQYSTVVSSC